MTITNQRTCTCCNQTQPLSAFYKDRTKRDGYRLKCKSCTKLAKSKKCTYCKETKKVKDFYSGSSRCKSCESKRTKKRSKGSQFLTELDLPELANCLSAVNTQITSMKVCKSCSKDLQTDFFYPDSKELDGYRPSCQACERLERAGELNNPFIRQFTQAQQSLHSHIIHQIRRRNQ